MVKKKRGGRRTTKIESKAPKKQKQKEQSFAFPVVDDGSLIKEGLIPNPERRVGYIIKKKKDPVQEPEKIKSFAVPQNVDGSVIIDVSGYYGTYIDLDGVVKTEFELISRYRDMSLQPEVDYAIEEIVNEAIVLDEDNPPVELDIDESKTIPNNIKKLIKEEFDNILKLLDFENQAYDIFKRWYVDGRMYYHKMIDLQHPKLGIQELRYIDPRQIRKVKQIKRGRDPETGVETIDIIDEYFVYNARGIVGQTHAIANHGVKIAKDTICYVYSGIQDAKSTMILSNLHKAIKPYNQLRMMQDATVIYKIARAPARRLFNIDVANLPRKQAEQYMQKVIANYKSKLVYDSATGDMRDDRKHMSMLEDFWFPKREGASGSTVTELGGSEAFDKMEGVEYFKHGLYKSLNVPFSRLESGNGFNLGRATEITRDELKFTKFTNRLRSKFTMLFDDLLKTQLQLKGILNEEDWDEIKGEIYYKFATDSYFTESKEIEVLHSRVALLKELGEMENLVGKYFSIEFIRRNILRQTDEEIREIDKQIQAERGKEAEAATVDMKLQAEIDKKAAAVDFETNKYMEKHGYLPPEPEEGQEDQDQAGQPQPIEKKKPPEEEQDKKDRK